MKNGKIKEIMLEKDELTIELAKIERICEGYKDTKDGSYGLCWDYNQYYKKKARLEELEMLERLLNAK